MKKQLPYALFDMDGTLVDSMTQWMEAPLPFARRAMPDITPEQEDLVYRTHDYRDIVALFASWGVNVNIMDLIHASEDEMVEHYKTDVFAKPGALPLLEELKAKGVKMGIITMTPHREVDVCLARNGLADYFSFVLTTEDTSDGSGKEKPEIFGIALNKLGCKNPSECMFFEDSLYAIDTAHKLGFYVVGVYEYWTKSERMGVLADECINLD